MDNVVFIAGAGDAAGRRLRSDFAKKGFAIAAGVLTGQEVPESLFTVPLDPLSQESADTAVRMVDETFGRVDMLVLNYDCCPVSDSRTILDPPDYEGLRRAYDWNTLAPLRAIHAFLPLLAKGAGKRICIVTTAAGSNNCTRDIGDYPGHVSRAPLNMAIHQLFNDLRPEGYTFRMYCKDPTAAPEKIGEFAVEYFTRNHSNEPESYKHSDENRLVLRDWMNIELPW